MLLKLNQTKNFLNKVVKMEKLSTKLIDEINYKMIKGLKNLRNVIGRIDIDINTRELNILKKNGINGRFQKNEEFENLIKFKMRRYDAGDFYIYKDLKVKVRSFKPLTFVNENRNTVTMKKPYSIISIKYCRVGGVE